ncbi:hypothetical protein CVT24_006899 [Panaeolus cyanescens]|uniref:Altered inheritance of mitochondria protein 9, mitochondrial n=1 Tax=Panaeolus cyanescens TaxID=181874 RepID=A0A409YNV1_9AGAR|nr:hypothetical protein CVT24_006899 [Panaeolus cyanescens]
MPWKRVVTALRRLKNLGSTEPNPESFFRYTSGKWLHDQKNNEALRYRRFNVDALKEEVKRSTGGLNVVRMSKWAEGRSNKVFLVQLSDGREVIARIPMPLAGPPHVVTASEVATMTFLRNRLGLTQVPRVISWSSQASKTPVGAEFIIMDLAGGIELADVWDKLTVHQKTKVVSEWVKFETKVIHAFEGGGYGSLYFRQDVPSDVARDVFLPNSNQPDSDYVLGPSVSQQGYWKDECLVPEDLIPQHGPWPDVLSYLKSITIQERHCIEKMAKRRTRKYVAPWERPTHLQIPEDHIHLLNLYDKVAQYFIPSDERLLRPTMTLRDSHMYNIFISEEALARGDIEITSVIDWQHTTILPLYLAADIPRFIGYDTPKPGENEAEFTKEKKSLMAVYHALYAETGVDFAWAAALSVGIPRPTPQVMPFAARTCWHAGYVDLKKELIRVSLDWQKIAPDVDCPLASEGYTEQDLAQVRKDQALWYAARARYVAMEGEIGLRGDKSVTPDNFRAAVKTNQRLFDAWKAGLDLQELGNVNPAEIWPIGRDSLKSA